MGVEVVFDATGSAEWSSLGTLFRDWNIYQSWAYGESRAARTGGEVRRLAIYRDGQPIGMCQACVKRIPLVGGGVAQVYWGPLWRQADASASDLHDVLVAVREEFSQRMGLNVRVVSQIWHDQLENDLTRAFNDAGYRVAMPSSLERTIRVDLSSSLAELRAQLQQKWRNCLNHAERNRLDVAVGKGAALMDQFVELYDEMWEEKRFDTGVDVNEMRDLQGALPETERMVVHIATSEGLPVAGHVATVLGDTCVYLLGASNEMGRKLKASYLLQWKTIELAKKQDAQWYDLGGIDQQKNPGVYHFKSGMGGTEVDYLAPMVASGRAKSRHLVPIAERAYRLLRRYRRAS